MKILKALWDVVNGHKFNSGTAIVLLSLVLNKFFGAVGLGESEATVYATYIVQAVGAVVMIIGYIHKLVKPKK